MANKNRNLRKRNGIYYFRKTHNGRAICLSLGTHLLTEAKRLKAQIEDFYRACGYYPSKLAAMKQPNQEEVPVFGELAVQWFEMRQGKLKKAAIRDFRNSLNNFFLPEFGNTPINQITAFDIEVFINKLDVRLKRAQAMVCPMRNVFKMAKKADYLEKDPFLDVDLKSNTIKNVKPKPDPFSKEEVSLIIENIDPFYKNLATVLFYTGMRLSEMAAQCRFQKTGDLHRQGYG